MTQFPLGDNWRKWLMMERIDTNWTPVLTEGEERPRKWLVTCDHATNAVPPDIATLGLSTEDMQRHIAFDPGALDVARSLGKLLNAPVVGANFSRLVIDPNRGADDPTLLMKLYDGTIIPGNRNADAAEIARRKALCYTPYHTKLAELANHDDIAIVSIHSFTPQLRGRPKRPWDIGVLYASDRRLADPLMSILQEQSDLCVGDNQPYTGHLPGDAIDQHGLQHNRPNVLIELRQDLIATAMDQSNWAKRLAPALEAAHAAANL